MGEQVDQWAPAFAGVGIRWQGGLLVLRQAQDERVGGRGEGRFAIRPYEEAGVEEGGESPSPEPSHRMETFA